MQPLVAFSLATVAKLVPVIIFAALATINPANATSASEPLECSKELERIRQSWAKETQYLPPRDRDVAKRQIDMAEYHCRRGEDGKAQGYLELGRKMMKVAGYGHRY